MRLIILKSPHGYDEDALRIHFEVFERHEIPLHFINHPETDAFMRNAMPLTKVGDDALQQKGLLQEKFQHCLAAEHIKKSNFPYAWVVVDTVRFKDPSFAIATATSRMSDADISIFSAPNLPMSGIRIADTSWVYLDSEDPTRNNIATAYLMTKAAATKIYTLRNDILNNGKSFAHTLQGYNLPYALERITTYASLHPIVTKPLFFKPA